jgi:hypothetical protein
VNPPTRSANLTQDSGAAHGIIGAALRLLERPHRRLQVLQPRAARRADGYSNRSCSPARPRVAPRP